MLKQWWLKWREPKPFNEGYLPEADGHRIYFAEYGKKGGKPVLLTHGGPGGQTHAGHAAVFDLKKYRVIMFDQRGAANRAGGKAGKQHHGRYPVGHETTV